MKLGPMQKWSVSAYDLENVNFADLGELFSNLVSLLKSERNIKNDIQIETIYGRYSTSEIEDYNYFHFYVTYREILNE